MTSGFSDAFVVAGEFNVSSPAPTSGQKVPLQVDAAGNLLVNVAVGGGGGGSNPSVGADNAAAPTSSTQVGTQDAGGKLQAVSSSNPLPITLPTGTAVELLDSGGTNKASISAAGAVKVDGSAVTQPVSGTVTANAGTNLNTSALALDATLTGGSQKTKIVDSAGTNLAAVSAAGAVKVDGSAVTQPVSGTVSLAAATAVELLDSAGTNKASISAAGAVKVDGSAVTQPVSGTVTANQGTANATPWNENIAQVGGTAAAATAKGTQATNGIGIQELKDSGRSYLSFSALAAAGVVAEALFSFSQNKQGIVTAGVSSYTITNGKTLRITSISISVRAGAAAVPFSRCALRHNPAGATIATSPIAYLVPEVFGISATIGVGGQISVPIPDGLEFFGNGTQTIGMSHLDQATTNILNVTVYGFEY